jgi:hypothetical protein
MGSPVEGGCQCGAVRYRISGDPISLVACHCTECQRQSGSAFGMSLVVRKTDFALSGNVKVFRRIAESGKAVDCAFCPECGTRVYHEPERMNGMAVNVRAGTLDDTSALAPVAHAWTKSKQPWFAVPEGVTEFEEQP